MTKQQSDQQLWQRTIKRIEQEVAALNDLERDWLSPHLAEIGRLQRQLHELFEAGDGGRLCAECLGACCERGRNHLTLANVLSHLLSGQQVPEPDFSRTCPFLGPAGCLLEVEGRPFNCVTFICDAIEDRLAPAMREDFYRLEKELRSHYLALDKRFAGSSLRGLLIRAERLGEKAFMGRIDDSVL